MGKKNNKSSKVTNKPNNDKAVNKNDKPQSNEKNFIKKVLKDDELSDDNKSESSDEDFDGIDEESMQNLIKKLGEDGLDDEAKFQLSYLNSLENGDENDNEEDDDVDNEESENGIENEAELSEDEGEEVSEDEDEDEEDVPDEDDNDFINDENDDVEEKEEEVGAGNNDDEEEEEDDDDDEGIDLEEAGDVDENTRAQAKTKIIVNNKPALKRILNNFKLSHQLPFVEHLSVTSSNPMEEVDPQDDLNRELVFYKQALQSVEVAKPKIIQSGIPFSRPNDFFAEMVKTDSHMEKIRQSMLNDKSKIEASEKARRQRELKKVGKKVQVEKQLERQKSKKDMLEKVKSLKRKKGGVDSLDPNSVDDDFDVQLDDALDDENDDKKNDSKRRKLSRSARDAKFGFGGKKKYSKSNTKESADAPYSGKKKSKKSQRPGKSRRMAGK